MKQAIILFIALFISGGAMAKMIVESTGINNGIIEDKYGAKGNDFIEGMPSYSLPMKITNAPQGTQSFALILMDYDAVPVAGFPWIHWIVANLKKNELVENEAFFGKDFVQGTNSWSSGLLPKSLGRLTAATYGGMAPPNGPHTYELTVYALDTELPLQKGFYLNELLHAMEGHILETAVLKGIYSN